MLGETMDLREALRRPGRLCANPQWYDYVHFIDLRDDGAVTMIAGGGQALRRRIEGTLELLEVDERRARVRFSGLRDADPYARSLETRTIADLELDVVVEPGPFALCREVMWRVEEDERPWLLFEDRLAFAADPLAGGEPQVPDWPPELLDAHPEARALWQSMHAAHESARRYYVVSAGEELPQRAVLALGLPPSALVR